MPNRNEVTRGWIMLRNEDLNNLYSSPIANHIKEDFMDWVCSTHLREISPAVPTQAATFCVILAIRYYCIWRVPCRILLSDILHFIVIWNVTCPPSVHLISLCSLISVFCTPYSLTFSFFLYFSLRRTPCHFFYVLKSKFNFFLCSMLT
jgi:hypothetical protein